MHVGAWEVLGRARKVGGVQEGNYFNSFGSQDSIYKVFSDTMKIGMQNPYTWAF